MKARPVVELLLKARERVSNPDLWTVGVVSVIEQDPEKRKYCAIHTISIMGATWGFTREQVTHACNYLNKVATREFGEPREVPDQFAAYGEVSAARVNDRGNHADVIKMFDIAINDAIEEGRDGSLDDRRQGAGHSGSGYPVLLDVETGEVVASSTSKESGWRRWFSNLIGAKQVEREKEYV